eukprot:2557892-Prymnesium_polylepis.1
MVDRIGRAQQFAAVAHAAGWVLEPFTSPAAETQDAQNMAARSLAALQRDSCQLYELRRRGPAAAVEPGLAAELCGGVLDAEYARVLGGGGKA